MRIPKHICKFCEKPGIDGRHEAVCGKNPNRRGFKKGDKHNRKPTIDKTAGTNQAFSPTRTPTHGVPPAESKPKKLTEININGEFETMAEKIIPKTDKKNSSEDKYECGGCGRTFNHFAEGHKCPQCGIDL